MEIEDDCPAELRALIETDAAAIQAKSVDILLGLKARGFLPSVLKP